MAGADNMGHPRRHQGELFGPKDNGIKYFLYLCNRNFFYPAVKLQINNSQNQNDQTQPVHIHMYDSRIYLVCLFNVVLFNEEKQYVISRKQSPNVCYHRDTEVIVAPLCGRHLGSKWD